MTTAQWTIEAGRPPEPVAESVLDGIRHYGMPAMQAAMDSPGIPADQLVDAGQAASDSPGVTSTAMTAQNRPPHHSIPQASSSQHPD